MKKLSIVFAAALLAACATEGSSDANADTASGAAATSTAEEATQAIAKAETASKRTDEVGFGWRDTEKLIKDAKTAADKKDFAAAVRLAKSAEQQSEQGYQQYLASQNHAKK